MNKQWNDKAIFACFIAALLVAACMAWVAYSALEARSFNRITGSDVTTFDAMFVQLRVLDASTKD